LSSALRSRGPELLSPAATLKNMRCALAYGADAVYAGLPRYSLRARNNDFDAANLEVGIAEAHEQGRRFYLACPDTELEGLANRGYTEGFYRRYAPADLQNYERGSSDIQRRIFVGEVTGSIGGWAEIQVKNRFAVGDELELLTPAGNRRFRLARMEDTAGASMDVAAGAGYRVRVPVPVDDCSLGLITRAL